MRKYYSLVLREKGLEAKKNGGSSSKALHTREVDRGANFTEEPEILEIASVEHTDLVVRIGPDRINDGGLYSEVKRKSIMFSQIL